MSTVVGARKMAIAEGCIPGDRLYVDNVSPKNAHVELTFCAEGEKPLGPFRLTVPAQRSRALDDVVAPDTLSPDTVYAVAVVSDATIVVHI
ncbi:sensory rhodopsin transducer [Nonomuraea sp. B19D2]|uniref:sensory rhodopsin transducer n=1 Tax=Nonomuraea sp. B19D2 TaxID=3159561 RepID=UPI0032DB23C1